MQNTKKFFDYDHEPDNFLVWVFGLSALAATIAFLATVAIGIGAVVVKDYWKSIIEWGIIFVILCVFAVVTKPSIKKEKNEKI